MLPIKYMLLFIVSYIAVAHCRQLPSFIKPCKKNDPNLEKCLIDLINGIKPRLRKGIPEMRIPPLDPFVVPLVRLNQGSEAVNFKATFKNITAYNGYEFTINKIKLDFDAPSISLEVYFPLIKINSEYNINGKILVVPINGNGKSYGNITKTTVNLVMKGKYIPKNHKNHLSIVGREIHFNIGKLFLHFDNLFGGKNKQLSDTTNNFINENWKDILVEINPLLEETIGEVLSSVIKGFLDLFAIEDLFPAS